MRSALTGLVLGLSIAMPASAGIIFSDNFNGDTTGLNDFSFLGGWVVTNGTVDTVSGGLCDDGNCVDLDGSTGNAGEFTKTLNLTGGVTYNASFQVGGNRRGGSDVLDVFFGTASFNQSFTASDPYTTFSLNFTPAISGAYNLTFAAQSNDNVGPLLDNVAVRSVDSAIPEPATWAMMIIGFGAAGSIIRRRKAVIA